jgi:hypothetical protein
MPDHLTPVYREPRRDACEGVAVLRQDAAEHYWLGNVKVVALRPEGEFTTAECTDAAIHYIRTTDLDQARQEPLRAFYCACGALLVGDDDADLLRLGRMHAERAHPERAGADEQLRAVIRANAFVVDHPRTETDESARQWGEAAGMR